MDLLNFLLYWSSRVYEWFGGLYDRGRQAALYAFSWAVTYASQTLLAAIKWADDRTNGALSTAWNWIIEKYEQGKAITRDVRNYLLGELAKLIGWVLGEIAKGIDAAKAKAYEVRDDVKQKLSEAEVRLKSGIAQTKNETTADIRGVETTLNTRMGNITGRVGKIEEAVNGQNSAGVPVLLSFLTNPFGFILAYIWGAFQDLLCFGLAYGLGTLKYDLPPLPDWTGGGISGGYIPPSTGPAGPSGLVSPLGSISVSGYTFGPSHKGVDLGLNNGDPVYAMHEGQILEAGFSNVGYGFTVVVSGGAWWSRYAHLQSLGVKVGDNVKAGQALGIGDSTGNSTGPHLHLEIKYQGNFIDPLTVL